MAGILIRPQTARSWLLWLLLALLGREATAASTGGASSDRVLVLASYYPGHFWQQTEVDAVLAGLKGKRPGLSVDVEYLDIGRYTAGTNQDRIVPALLAKYGLDRWRVVVLVDQRGLDFGMRHRLALFPSAALVFCGVENFPEAMAAANPHVTGVMERIDAPANARLALELQPELKNLLVIGSDPSGVDTVDAVRAALVGRAGAPVVESFENFNLQELFARLATLPPDSAVIFLGFGGVTDYAAEIDRRTPVPIYSIAWPTFRGMGMGGVMVDAEFQGEDTAAMVLKVLDGTAPSAIPILRNPRFRTVVDYKALKRFGIPAGRVPSGAEMVNLPETLWSRHRTAVLATAALFVVLAGLVIGLSLALRQKDLAKKALARGEQRFRHLVENSDDMVLELDAGQRVTYASPNCRRWLGFQPSELTGKTIAGATQMEPSTAAADEHRPIRRHRHKDGSWRSLEWSTREAATESGGRVSVVVLRDVTERLAAEESRQALEKRVQQAEKMESLGTLAGGIAHDFNNLLTPILGHASMLEETSQDPESLESVREIAVAANRAADLVRSILTFSRVGPHRRAPTDLSCVVEESRKLLRAGLPSAIRIDTRVAPLVPAVLADRTRVQQILLNLGHNAAHAMEDGGTVTISLTLGQASEEFAALHPPLKAGPKVVLEVSDTGAGIDPATMKRIFEPFFTTKAPGKGTGLGLSVVLGIVQDHLAAITVESEPGKGARFRIYFEPTDAVPEAAPARAIRAASTRGGLILLVDDEASVVHVGSAMLRQLGYTCEAYTDPRQALDRMGDASLPPVDLLITDLSMPHINGILLAEKVLSINPAQRIVLASGLTETIGSELVRSKGIADVLPKPYGLAGLSAVVARVLSQPGGGRSG